MKTIFAFMIMLSMLGCSNEINWEKEPQGMVRLSNETSQQTPKGAYVYSKDGITPAQLAEIDNGLQSAFTDAISSGYSNTLNSNQYLIQIPYYPCELSPVQRIPSFKIRGDVYDGTEFDQYNPKGAGVKDGIGVILAAEMVTNPSGIMIICPDSPKEAARNGAEHIIVYTNDQDYYSKTWYHGDGVYHPILPKRELLKTSASKPYDGSSVVVMTK